MRNFSILLAPFCYILFFSGMYAQDSVLKDGFYIQVNLEKNEVYLSDINETKLRISPRDNRDTPIGLYAINVQFQKERNEMEKNIFSEDEIDQLIEYRIVSRIYINSETEKIDAVSFLFRNMDKNDIKTIDTNKFSEYREMLKNQMKVQTLIFEREIVKHGYVDQLFRVLYEK